MAQFSDFLQWFLVALVVLLVVELWRKMRGLPPGPWGLPLLGYNMFLKEPVHLHFHELSKRYGGVFSFRTIGGNLVVVLAETSLIKETFVNRAEEFIGKTDMFNLLNWVDGGLGIAQTEGTAWKEQRKFFLSSAKNFGFGKVEYEGYLHELLQKMVNYVRAKSGKPFSICLDVSHVTCSAVAKIMCSAQFEKDDPRFLKLANGFRDMFQTAVPSLAVAAGWYLRLLFHFSPGFRKAEKARLELHAVVSKILQERIATFDPHNIRDYVDTYLSHMKTLEKSGQFHGSSFTMDRLKAILFNMLMEGTESTSATIVSLITEMSHYVDEQRKVQKEIDEVVGRDRLPSWADRASMPYTDAFLNELYRTGMFFPHSTFYNNFKETTIAGYRIPERTLLVVLFWSINNDPKYFPNPSKFSPDRFLGPDGKRIKTEGSPVPFGIGKRSCIGESLAQMEVFLIITCLLQNFTIRATGKEGEVMAEPRV